MVGLVRVAMVKGMAGVVVVMGIVIVVMDEWF